MAALEFLVLAMLVCSSVNGQQQSFGSWGFKRPTCDKPETPRLVRVVEQSPPTNESPNKFRMGSFIKYACFRGSTMSGSDTIRCMSNGLWSNQPPTCERGDREPQNYCQKPEVPNNDPRIQSQSPTVNDDGITFRARSTITYMCRWGSTMVGEAVITCNSDGNWDRQPPQCTSGLVGPVAPRCRRPDAPVNGRIAYSYPDGTPNFYPPSGRVRFACNIGYQLQGSSTIECQANGRWSPASPTCTRRFF